ncbi:hypothetical protein, partial [Serratia marcescens]
MQLGYEVNSGTFTNIFPTIWLNHENKILPGTGILLVKSEGVNKYKFETYSSGTVSPVYFQYSKLWDNIPLHMGYYSNCDNQYHEGKPMKFEFLSGDFNGDGLSDQIAVSLNEQIITGEYPDPIYP